jgi:hypothetical protein
MEVEGWGDTDLYCDGRVVRYRLPCQGAAQLRASGDPSCCSSWYITKCCTQNNDMSEIMQGRQGLAELGSSCRVCQLLDCERRLVYPRVMALHTMRDFSGGGSLGTNDAVKHLRAAEQPLLEQSVPFHASIAVQITPPRPI